MAYWSVEGVVALIPAKGEPSQSRVPMRLFRYDARNNVVKCPGGKTLIPRRSEERGRYYGSRTRDCAGCALKPDCLSKSRASKEVLVPHEYPALLRARRRHARWGEGEKRLYDRHRWRSEGYHGEAKSRHGLGRAVRRGLANVRVQSYLTAIAVNLKLLAAARAARLFAPWRAWFAGDAVCTHMAPSRADWVCSPKPRETPKRLLPKRGFSTGPSRGEWFLHFHRSPMTLKGGVNFKSVSPTISTLLPHLLYAHPIGPLPDQKNSSLLARNSPRISPHLRLSPRIGMRQNHPRIGRRRRSGGNGSCEKGKAAARPSSPKTGRFRSAGDPSPGDRYRSSAPGDGPRRTRREFR